MSIQPTTRRGFTLAELMIVLAIITTLTSMMVFVLVGAREESNRLRTVQQIRRMHELIAVQWEDLQYRTVQFKAASLAAVPDPKERRLLGLRELARCEFPSIREDVLTPPTLVVESPRLQRIRNRLLQDLITETVRQGGAAPSFSTPGVWDNEEISFVSNAWFQDPANLQFGLWTTRSECLYLIMATTRDDEGDFLRFFSASELQDVDSDGVPEIHDAWNTPIAFFRWAPGFISPYQNGDDPDPFDPFAADPDNPVNTSGGGSATFQLFPLIISAGNDQNPGLLDFLPTQINDPYETVRSQPRDLAIGASLTANSGDNIDNQWDLNE